MINDNSKKLKYEDRLIKFSMHSHIIDMNSDTGQFKQGSMANVVAHLSIIIPDVVRF